MNKISFKHATAIRRSFLFAASLATLGFPACATSSPSSLPVQVDGKSGFGSAIRIYESKGEILVGGSVQPGVFGTGNHVDVKLVGPGNRVVAVKTERVSLGHPRGTRARHGVASFVASFPVETVRGVDRVVVTVHHGAPSRCQATQG